MGEFRKSKVSTPGGLEAAQSWAVGLVKANKSTSSNLPHFAPFRFISARDPEKLRKVTGGKKPKELQSEQL